MTKEEIESITEQEWDDLIDLRYQTLDFAIGLSGYNSEDLDYSPSIKELTVNLPEFEAIYFHLIRDTGEIYTVRDGIWQKVLEDKEVSDLTLDDFKEYGLEQDLSDLTEEKASHLIESSHQRDEEDGYVFETEVNTSDIESNIGKIKNIKVKS